MQQAVDINPFAITARHRLGVALAEPPRNDWRGAREHLAEAVRLAPHLLEPRIAFARILVLLGEFPQARQEYEVARGLGNFAPFQGEYDRPYFDERWRIGMTHVRVGIPPWWVEAVTSFLREAGLELITASAPGPEGVERAQSYLKILDIDLWIINLSSLETRLLYEGDTAFGGRAGLSISPDGRTIAAREGSGFGDACFVDLRLLFFEVAADFQSVKAIPQAQFAGLPEIPDGVIYPTGAGSWDANNDFVVPLSVTCAPDESLNGVYVFDVATLQAAKR